jgi:hypothetical protein
VPVVGSRFLIEAGFIIAVAVVAGLERLGTWWIILVVAAAWIVVAVVEIAVWLRQVAGRQAEARAQPAVAMPPSLPAVTVQPLPMPPRSRAPEPEPAWEPPRLASVPPPPAPERAFEPEPEPVAEVAPTPEPVAVQETASVLAFTPSQGAAPREWNLWELERAARDHSDDDVARVEERSYLLMYLREFAGPDGVLPADFDGLVRDAFGDVLHSVGA